MARIVVSSYPCSWKISSAALRISALVCSPFRVLVDSLLAALITGLYFVNHGWDARATVTEFHSSGEPGNAADLIPVLRDERHYSSRRRQKLGRRQAISPLPILRQRPQDHQPGFRTHVDLTLIADHGQIQSRQIVVQVGKAAPGLVRLAGHKDELDQLSLLRQPSMCPPAQTARGIVKNG